MALLQAVRGTGLARSLLGDLGLRVPKKSWARAALSDKAPVRNKPRGRPSKVADPTLISQVQELVKQNSQPTSVWLERAQTTARVLTTSLLGLYLSSGFMKKLGWKQFFFIVRKNCAWARKAQKKTDFCDHCHLYRTSIAPGSVKSIKVARDNLMKLLPTYFVPFDTDAPSLSDNAVEHLEAFYKYVFSHDKNRAQDRRQLSRTTRLALHEKEAAICHRLRHEVKVAQSYAWHVQTAERQAAACHRDKRNMERGDVILWMDYKAKFSLPCASVETSDMYWGSQRKELTVFGIVVADFLADEVRQQNIFYISSIIENTGLMTSELLSDVLARMPALQQAKRIIFWSDVGLHFRSYNVVAYIAQRWFRPLQCEVLRICWFCERHGKGEVDSMFSHFGSWVAAHVRQPNKVIKTEEELVAICQAAAQADARLQPSSPLRWVVRRFEADVKPGTVTRLASCSFSITKTYCLQLERPYANRARMQIRNCVFADVTTGPTEAVSLLEEPVAASLQYCTCTLRLFLCSRIPFCSWGRNRCGTCCPTTKMFSWGRNRCGTCCPTTKMFRGP